MTDCYRKLMGRARGAHEYIPPIFPALSWCSAGWTTRRSCRLRVAATCRFRRTTRKSPCIAPFGEGAPHSSGRGLAGNGPGRGDCTCGHPYGLRQGQGFAGRHRKLPEFLANGGRTAPSNAHSPEPRRHPVPSITGRGGVPTTPADWPGRASNHLLWQRRRSLAGAGTRCRPVHRVPRLPVLRDPTFRGYLFSQVAVYRATRLRADQLPAMPGS